jgi:hypothetical protein
VTLRWRRFRSAGFKREAQKKMGKGNEEKKKWRTDAKVIGLEIE